MTDAAQPSGPSAADGPVDGPAPHTSVDRDRDGDDARRRLRPVRAGIIGLWDYTVAEFAFADGRLVLRGANGSGKTKALEVLFPFVLDGRLDPRRLDPFSGENRTMKDNLLWGGRDTGHGYTWLEFGDGQRWVTVGVGLRAQKHRQSPDSWFFVTDRQIGHDLHLVDDEDRPRTKRDLAAELGEVVVDRASDHRRRVDDALFGLGPERYEAMLDLVLTLRRPMLAKDLDPRLLSETLTRGLRPLDDDLIEQVARSFDDLEAVQRELDRIIAADEAATTFVTDYRGYLRTQARHRADQAIEADAAAREARAALDDAERRIDQARAAESMTEAELETTSARLEQDRARRDALRASDAFRSAEQLEHLATAVRDLAAERDRAMRRSDEATQAADAEVAASEDAQRAADEAAREFETQRSRIVDSATAAGIDWDVTDGHGPSAELRQRTAGRAAARRADLEVVEAALSDVTRATERAESADAVEQRAHEAEAAAASSQHEADRAAGTARDDLLVAIDTWAAAHPDVVHDEDREAVRAAVVTLAPPAVDEAPPSDTEGGSPSVDTDGTAGDGATTGTGEQRAADVWRDRLQPRLDAVREQRTRQQGHLEDLRARRSELEEHRQAILDERDDAPAALPWHGDDRTSREGAPLWATVRFADDVTPDSAAGIEAALEAAGLLDAWVRPDGTVSDDADVFLVVASELVSDGVTEDPTLADVLVAEDQGHVPAATVDRLLRSVPLRDLGWGAPAQAQPADTGPQADGERTEDLAIGRDGRYRIGPLAGRHQATAARYIGATARAAHRAQRVERLDQELADLHGQVAEVEARVADGDRQLGAAKAATTALPSDDALRARIRARDLAAGRLQQARTASAAAEDAAGEARRVRNERQHALQREARARGLPADPDGLADVAAALARFSDDGHALVTASERQETRDATAAEAANRATAAVQAAELADADADARRRHHDARAAELETLRDQLGDEAREVVEQLGRVEAAIEEGGNEEQRLSRAAREAAAARGEAEGKLGGARDALQLAEDAARSAREHLRRFARADIAGPLDLEPPEDDDALLTAIDDLVTGVSGADERRKAAQTRVTRALEELDRALGSDHRPSWAVDDDLIVVTISDDGRERSIAAFASQLAAQRAEQEALLTERERTLFEDALLSSVCSQIHTRTQATRELVATMDTQMRARRLSSGQTVGVAWRPDDTVGPEWQRVHRLLDQDPAHFGPDQLETLRRHFAAEIAAARAADPHAPYRELLANVLDYRRWRRFELSLIEADGSSAKLTRARHARLSGGEKAASLHLPLFAAAHGAFAGGRPDCPRLLGLDEAFAGIDDTGRSELLSLTVAFDLDLFMTGYDLWAVDAAVPGVAHYDLLHLPDAHSVSTLLVLWNGRELLEGPDATMALASATPPSPGIAEGESQDGWP